jgi:hypothetical protein
LISFFLNGLLLECKSMSLLKFFLLFRCVFEAMLIKDFINMQMEDRSWMYKLGDVLAHFKGVSIFFEATAQHATHEKEEAIYYPCKVCNDNVMYLYKDHEIICEHLVQSGFMDNYFI